MTAPAVVNELAKMRRLRVGPVVAAMVAGVVALSCVELASPGFSGAMDDSAGLPWHRLLLGLGFAVPLVSPVLIAVLAGRQVDLEHQGNGWLSSATAGLPAGRLCRAKLVATGAVLVPATVTASALVVGAGVLAGITVDLPLGVWAAHTASVVVVNLVLLALHVLVAAVVENQLVGTGIGVLGVFAAATAPAMPAWAAHLTPWGYYSLAAPVDHRDGELVALAPSHGSVVALGVAATVVFLLVSRRLDRREV
ncbi:hypothetical protein EV383_2733 [Pseudonocardia sediminis]|uniref:ABC-2 type transport system permease protein n=1 Tax=Pseudonocardia sediminis TaxID=1397368 RepID=A0A4Q7UVL3_PSEST|nr:ABC transporter permease [Pseudonocardia sediminis]RZT85846.1 hypothetical protein EV383_2733 [Pseudonocardia sediminis]